MRWNTTNLGTISEQELHKSHESRVCTISQPNIDEFCSNLVYLKAHSATEMELMPKHFGRKPYGCNNGCYYGRKAYGRTLQDIYLN